REELPKVRGIILLTGELPAEADPEWVISLDDLRRRGVEHLDANPGCIDERIDSTRLEHLATLIYTSGTTGRPKGVRLPHRVWVFEAYAVDATSNTGDEKMLTIDDKQFLWLPLAHVMGK